MSEPAVLSTPTPTFEENLRTFLNANCQLIKLLTIHRPDNQAVLRPLQDFERSFAPLKAEGISKQSIEMTYDDGVLSILGVKIQQHYSIMESLAYIPEVFEVAMIETLALDPQLEISSLLQFYSRLAQHAALHSKPKAFQFQAKGIRIVYLDPNKLAGREKSKELLKDPTYALQHHYLLRQLVDRFFYGFTSNTVISQKAIRRELMEICQIARIAPENVYALTLVDDTEGLSMGLASAIQQGVSTCLLSLLLAREIGMTSHDQIEMALLGLLYNVGTLIGEAHALTLEKRPLNEEEFKKVIEAQASGIYRLLKAQGKSRPVLERLLSIFEQTQSRMGKDINLSLDARLLRLTSQYSALTSPRPYRSAYLPHEALKILGAELRGRPGDWEGTLYYYLIRLLGVYPMGSYVELSDGRRAVVVRAQGEKPGYPVVLAWPKEDKSQTARLDLATTDLSITHALDPLEDGIAVTHYLFSSR